MPVNEMKLMTWEEFMDIVKDDKFILYTSFAHKMEDGDLVCVREIGTLWNQQPRYGVWGLEFYNISVPAQTKLLDGFTE